jgi:hypothetical protein
MLMAKFRVEYERTGATEWSKGVVIVTEFENRQLSEAEQFIDYAKNPEHTSMPDLKREWANRRILRVERVGF